jgi:hypothetical protein
MHKFIIKTFMYAITVATITSCKIDKQNSDINATKQTSTEKQSLVFLMGGQSNMEGYSPVSKEAVAQLSSVKNVYIYCAHHSAFQANSALWETGKKPSWQALKPCGGFPDTMGPEVSFGLLASKAFPDKDIYLIKYAKGSTSVFCNWQPPTRSSSYEKFQGDEACKSTANNDPSYLRFEKTLFDATSQIPGTTKWSWGGMLWLQGEQDAAGGKHSFFADNYQENLTHLISTIRIKLKNPHLPFVAAKIKAGSTMSPTGNGPSPLKLVRDAIQTVASKDPAMRIFDTWDLVMKDGDCWHFGSESMLTIGERFAMALDFKVSAGTFPAPKAVTCNEMYSGVIP